MKFFPLRNFHLLDYPTECDNVTTPYYAIFALLSVHWLTGGQKRFNFLAFKLLRSLTRGGQLQEVPNTVILLGKFWLPGKMVAEER